MVSASERGDCRRGTEAQRELRRLGWSVARIEPRPRPQEARHKADGRGWAMTEHIEPMAVKALAAEPLDDGLLANNAMTVQMLQSCLSRLGTDLSSAPRVLLLLDRGECWRAFQFPDMPQPVFRDAADFRQFIESPRPKGCGTPLSILRRAVEGTEAEATLRRLTGEASREQEAATSPEGPPGRPPWPAPASSRCFRLTTWPPPSHATDARWSGCDRLASCPCPT